jgi:metal-dependent HD superfamily phosphatase/phosphodiesterase
MSCVLVAYEAGVVALAAGELAEHARSPAAIAARAVTLWAVTLLAIHRFVLSRFEYAPAGEYSEGGSHP